MEQRDYVRRSQQVLLRRKKNNSRKQQNPLSSVLGIICTAVLIAFIASLFFNVYHKKNTPTIYPINKVTNNCLPPKPEERWHYIKELESHQPNGQTPSEIYARSQVNNYNNLTNEQRESVNKARWNKKIFKQHQQIPQFRLQLQEGQEKWIQTQPIQPNPKNHLYQDVRRMPKQFIGESSFMMMKKYDAQKQIKEKSKHYWMVQCGAFKGVKQAEIMRAKLAFEGFDACISTTNNGWNRVVIGPVKTKKNLDSTIIRLRLIGYTNCIQLSFKN